MDLWVGLLFLQVFQNFSRRIGARTSGQSRSSVRPRTAHVQILNGRAISRPIQQWTHGEKLVECQFSMKNVAAGQSVRVFQILRGDDLVRQNEFRKLGSVLRQRFDYSV